MFQRKKAKKTSWIRKISRKNLILIFCLAALLGFLLPGISIGGKPSQMPTREVSLPDSKPIDWENLISKEIFDKPRLSLSESNVKKTVRVVVTAYSSTPDQTDDTPFITATGNQVRDGIIAANFLPFGTRVRFPDHYGNKVFVVDDRMNKRFCKRADIWMPTREEAQEFGIRVLAMEVLE